MTAFHTESIPTLREKRLPSRPQAPDTSPHRRSRGQNVHRVQADEHRNRLVGRRLTGKDQRSLRMTGRLPVLPTFSEIGQHARPARVLSHILEIAIFGRPFGVGPVFFRGNLQPIECGIDVSGERVITGQVVSSVIALNHRHVLTLDSRTEIAPLHKLLGGDGQSIGIDVVQIVVPQAHQWNPGNWQFERRVWQLAGRGRIDDLRHNYRRLIRNLNERGNTDDHDTDEECYESQAARFHPESTGARLPALDTCRSAAPSLQVAMVDQCSSSCRQFYPGSSAAGSGRSPKRDSTAFLFPDRPPKQVVRDLLHALHQVRADGTSATRGACVREDR